MVSGDRSALSPLAQWMPPDVPTADLIYIFGLPLIIAILIRGFIHIYSGYFFTQTVGILSTDIRLRLFKSFQDNKLTDHEKIMRSGYLRAIESQAKELGGIVQAGIYLIGDGVFIFGVIIILTLSLPPLVVLVSLSICLIFPAYHFFVKGLLVAKGQAREHLKNCVIETVLQQAEGFRELKVLGKSSIFERDITVISRKIMKLNTSLNVIRNIPFFLGETFFAIAVVGTLMYQFSKGTPSASFLASMIILGIAVTRILPTFASMSTYINRIRTGDAMIAILIQNLTKKNPRKRGIPISITGPEKLTFQKLEFQDIHFRYKSDLPYILKSASITISDESLIGIQGESGAGKTTLIDLLLGLIEPEKGNILFNGQLVSNPLTQLQDLAYYVPQTPAVFNQSLVKNIILEDEKFIDQVKFRASLTLANFDKEVECLSDGIDTLLGDGGSVLSGGQRQRVALARAFYSNRPLLILDESLNALDEENEQEIFNNLLSLQRQKAIVLVTHKKSLLKQCNALYEIKSGAISRLR